MGRTALYRDPVPFRSARAEVQLDSDALLVRLPDGRARRYPLDGCAAVTEDGCRSARVDNRVERRFVRMLVLDRPDRPDRESHVMITPPEQGTVAPNVVRVPEAPADAAVIEPSVWHTLSDWLVGGGRLAALAIADLARLAMIATSPFAALIGEVAAQRALELAWAQRGPLRSGVELEISLQPLVEAARSSSRANEALVAALSHAAGESRRRKKLW